jgi:hypothetical protein
VAGISNMPLRGLQQPPRRPRRTTKYLEPSKLKPGPSLRPWELPERGKASRKAKRRESRRAKRRASRREKRRGSAAIAEISGEAREAVRTRTPLQSWTEP